MKVCPTCGINKQHDDFYKSKRTCDGLFYNCKKCKYSYRKKYVSKNREKVNKTITNWRKNNPDKVKLICNKWTKNNAIKVKIRDARYAKANPGKMTAKSNKRYSKKKSAFPEWLTSEQIIEIENIYIRCSNITKETGIKHNVDHIIPIQSDIVCGLHVPWNLQILTKTDNVRKGNKF